METEALRNLWVKALRSGKYEQAFGALGYEIAAPDDIFFLNTNFYYCPLGVALDILAPSMLRATDGLGRIRFYYGDGDSQELATLRLTEDALKKLGLTRQDETEIMYLNDILRQSLEEISYYIEHLPITT